MSMSSGSGGTRPDVDLPSERHDATVEVTLTTTQPRRERSDTLGSGISLTEHSLDGPTFVEGPRAMVETDVPRLERDPGFGERYVPDRVLGQGGMGTVRLNLDRQIGRRVAMKVMLAENADIDARSRFVREARIQGQLEHPSVVPVYDLALDPDGNPFFTMRRVRGLTLEEIVERLAMGAHAAFRDQHSRRRLLTAFSRVCLAVHYAHEHGVLHRDLKPANVILGEFGEVYVLDWGLAGIIESDVDSTRELKAVGLPRQTMPGSLLGTPGYVSPEQAMGNVTGLTPASDVYSLGAILFELLTWGPLHDGSSALSRLKSTLNGRECRPSLRAPEMRIDPELDQIVAKATAHHPKRRHASALALHREVEAYLDGRRNEEERLQAAQEQAQVASQRAETALEEGAGPEARRDALRVAVGALAFDPENALAMRTLVRLTTQPPGPLPDEVQSDLEQASHDRMRWVAGIAALTYAVTFVYIPFIAASVVTTWWPIVTAYAFLLAAAVVSLRVAQSSRPSSRGVLASMVLSNLGLAATAPLLGPLLLTPSLIAINTAPYGLYLGPRGRWLSLATGLALVSLTIALGLGGVLPGEYSFSEGRLVVHSGALGLAPLPTLVLLTVLALGQVTTAVFTVVRIRRDLDRAERLMHMQSWLLRGLAPSAASAAARDKPAPRG